MPLQNTFHGLCHLYIQTRFHYGKLPVFWQGFLFPILLLCSSSPKCERCRLDQWYCHCRNSRLYIQMGVIARSLSVYTDKPDKHIMVLSVRGQTDSIRVISVCIYRRGECLLLLKRARRKAFSLPRTVPELLLSLLALPHLVSARSLHGVYRYCSCRLSHCCTGPCSSGLSGRKLP